MNPVLDAAGMLQAFCQAQGWHFCFIGGVAVQRWGEPRGTMDADLTLLSGFGQEESFIDPLLERFEARVDDARDFALIQRVLLLRADNHIPLDVAMAGMPFEERCVERASPHAYLPDLTLITCSAEDLVIHKAFAGRERDWLDIEGIIHRRGPRLDRLLIREELKPLLELKEDLSPLERLARLFEEA